MPEIATKERPVRFVEPEVKATLAGLKTQFRRTVKPQPIGRIDPVLSWGPKGLEIAFGPDNRLANGRPRWWACPHGKPGDRLWVKETWATMVCYDHCRPGPECDPYYFKAGGDKVPDVQERGRWRASIHMPRWASRIAMEITDVRVERLQEISGEDARAEGADCRTDLSWEGGTDTPYFYGKGYIAGFEDLWESINGKGSWDRNDWVWVVGFKRIGVAP